MMHGDTNPPGQHSRDRWAARVVNDVLKETPARHVRRGYLATTMSWVNWLVPWWLLDYGFLQPSDLAKLTGLLDGRGKEKK
jgi:hypothetical protein